VEFRQGPVATSEELRDYSRWRDRYAREADRCRRYEPSHRASPTKRYSARLDLRLVRRALGDLPPGSLVLDLPCGGGRISRALGAVGLRTVAADYSPHMLAESRDASVLRTRADALRLPFADAAFDAAVCFRFMQSVPRPLRVRVLAELGRVAGRVVVNYQNVFSLRSLRRFVQRRPLPHNRLSEPQVASEVEEAGLEVLAFQYKTRLFFEDFVVVARRTPS